MTLVMAFVMANPNLDYLTLPSSDARPRYHGGLRGE
jgi:hypothetical protein